MNSKKKLIRVTTSDVSLDGLLEGQLKFLNEFYEVVGVSDDSGSLDMVANREGIRTVAVKMSRNINLRQDFLSLLHLIKLFLTERPYIVHANTPKGSLLAMIAARITRVPHRIYTVTGLRFETTHGKFRFLLKIMERITCYCATKVIPEGDGVKNTLYREHITQKPLHKILNGNINGIDVTHFSTENSPISRIEIRKPLNITDDNFAFVFVGRIVKDKGMNELAEAMKRLTSEYENCKLILVGRFEPLQDPINEEIETYFKTDNHILYVGFQYDVRPYILAADALVFPSYREGFPNVVLQAGAMGLPSIVTDINGCNEIIKEGVNGTIVPAQNTDALYKAMKRFIDHRHDDTAKMATNAREMITSRYEQKAVWHALLQEYQDLK